jgi:hypothetical protein
VREDVVEPRGGRRLDAAVEVEEDLRARERARVGAGEPRARGLGEGLRRARGHRGEEYSDGRAEAGR